MSNGSRLAPTGDSGAVLEAMFAVMRLVRQSSTWTQTPSLSPARYQALHELLHHGPMHMGQLAERLGVVARSITGPIDALEASGCVERTDDPNDRRAKLLILTAKGKRQLQEARRVRLGNLGGLIEAALDSREQKALHQLLLKIVAAHRDPASG